MDIEKYKKDIRELGAELENLLCHPWPVLDLILPQDYRSDLADYILSNFKKQNDDDLNIINNKERIIKEELCRISANNIDQILQSLPKYLGDKGRKEMYEYALTCNGFVWLHTPKYYRRPLMHKAAIIQLKNLLSIVPEYILNNAA